MSNENVFLATASRHQRKSQPVKRPFSVQTLLILVAITLIASSFLIGNDDESVKTSQLEIKKPSFQQKAVPVISVNGETITNTEQTSIAQLSEAVPVAELLDGERARTLIKATLNEQATPSAIFKQAESFRDTGKYTDAWLLYFYAARQGHSGSAAALATMSDPDTFKNFGSPLDHGDAFQALKWYSIASKQGYTGIEKQFNRFRNVLKSKANAGHARSLQLLQLLGNV